MNYDDQLLDIFLDFGEVMLGAGGEISRVEDSIARMGRAYGAVKTSVFIIPSSMELTMTFSDGETVTRTRRIKGGGAVNFHKLQDLNAISRRCAVDCLSVDVLRDEIEKIRTQKIPAYKNYLGSAMAASAFCLFFGGTIFDAVAAVFFGLFVAWLQDWYAPLTPNKVFNLFSSSLVMGVGVCLLAKIFPILNIDMIIIGVIMLLIPGVATTVSIRDTLVGDTISGITKLMDALVWAAAQAAGIMVAILIFVG